jgi:beta-lactamase regulating signal transducer with metallopeptidase domain
MPVPFLESAARAVFHASWQAAVLAMIVLVATRLVPRMPAGARSGLWLIVLARLLFPLTPQSSWSLFNLARFSAGPSAVEVPTAVGTTGTEQPASVAVSRPSEVWTVVASRPLPFAHIEAQKSKTIAADGPEVEERTGLLLAKAPSIADALSSIWALGVAVVVASGIRSWFRLRRFVRACRLCADEGPRAALERCRRELGLWRKVTLLVSDADVASALAGVAFPRIIVSKRTLAAIGPAELEWLFRHELAHVRRWDLAVSRLWWCVRALHWFNPLVWWAASRACVEAEMACDESVLARSAASERAAYGHTLLTAAELLANSAPVPAAAGISLGEPALSRRIRAIAVYRPASRGANFAVVLVLIGVACGGLTDAIENSARGAGDPEKSPVTRQSNAAPPSGSNQASVRPTFGLPADAQGRPQLAAVLDAWQKGHGRLKSYDVYLTSEVVPFSPLKPKNWPVIPSLAFGASLTFDLALGPNIGIGQLPQLAGGLGRKFSREMLSGEKLRAEAGVAKPGEKPAYTVWVWDGGKGKAELFGVMQYSVGGTRARSAAVYECNRSSCADGSDIVDVLRSRHGTVIERADEQGIVVYTPAAPATLAIGYRVWLDPSKGFQPTRIHRLLDLGGTLNTYLEQENTLDEVARGVWAPVKVVISRYLPSKKSATAPRRPNSVEVITVNRIYSRFNVPIDESLFQLAPKSSQVGGAWPD